MSDQRTGTCRICGRMDVAVTQVPGHPGGVCIDEVACFVEFRQQRGMGRGRTTRREGRQEDHVSLWRSVPLDA